MATTSPRPLPYEGRLRELEALYAQAQQTIAARVELARFQVGPAQVANSR